MIFADKLSEMRLHKAIAVHRGGKSALSSAEAFS
jgi:hypothetical protein